MPRKKSIIGVNEFMRLEYDRLELSPRWAATLGRMPKNASGLIWGESGNGKTSFCLALAKELAGSYGDKSVANVLWWSAEEGHEASLQDAIGRVGMQEVAGKISFAEDTGFADLCEILSRKNSYKCVFIDSLDYMKLSVAEFKELRRLFPNKMFWMVAWGGKNPWNEHARKIRYMCGYKIRVVEFKAFPVSRFGGNVPYVIWKEYEQTMKGLVGHTTVSAKKPETAATAYEQLEVLAEMGKPVRQADVPTAYREDWPVDVAQMEPEAFVEWMQELGEEVPNA
jgi:DNA polymerase III delta prime subunit